MAKKHHEEKKGRHHHKGKHRSEGGYVEEGEGEKDADFKRAGKKHGGKVHGKPAHHRPDRRARGGATSDHNPETTAGKMAELPFTKKQQPSHDEGGAGSHVHPD